MRGHIAVSAEPNGTARRAKWPGDQSTRVRLTFLWVNA
jgi:hypothetical protein